MSSNVDLSTGMGKLIISKDQWKLIKKHYIFTEKEMRKHYILNENIPIDNGRQQNN